MRIGIIAPPWVPVPPPAYGGTESVIDELARGLVAVGHEVVLAAAANSTCPVARVPGTDPAPEDAAIRADAVGEMRHVLTSYAAMAEMDVVHDHTNIGPLSRHSRGRYQLVTTNHGPFDARLSPLYRAMRNVAIVGISRHQAATAQGIPIAATIHHGLDLTGIPVGAGDGGYACFLGRMSADKGPREAAIIARTAGVPLRMAAKLREPAEREYFDAAVKPLLGGDVEYIGELGAREKLQLLGGSFALLNPIQWPEPFGLVMIEALATGTPVVATPAGSAPEIIRDGVTGYLRSDHPALALALLQAQSLDRHRCRAEAEERFTTERMVEDHLRLYKRLLAGDSTTPSLRIDLNGTSSSRTTSPTRDGMSGLPVQPAASSARPTPALAGTLGLDVTKEGTTERPAATGRAGDHVDARRQAGHS
jgi:glycosyltransferase involved in cell wall biosynthesis